MFDFVRIACAVPDVFVGDVKKNTAEILKYIEMAKQKNVNIAVFPELCTTAYTCADLFFRQSLTDLASESIREIAHSTEKCDIVLLIGAPLYIDGQLYNCAFVISKGKIWGIVPKTYIPTYNEFYEKRWFSSSADLKRKEISERALGYDSDGAIPVGADLTFDLDGVIFGAEICEDLWAPIPPSSKISLSGAEIIFNLSASNETIAKRQYRESIVKGQSASCLCTYAYAGAGRLESTTDLIFSGHSVISENGTIIAENKNYIDSGYLLCADTDLGKIRADRAKIKTFKDCATANLTSDMRRIIINGKCECDGSLIKVKKLPFVPDVGELRRERCSNIFDMQVSGLMKRLSVTHAKPVIGVSGGLDSTLTLLVSAMAAKRMNLDSTDVIGVTMPCFGTTDRTYTNSLKLMEALGVTIKIIPIRDAVRLHFADIGHNEEIHDLTYENCQARERTQVLMDVAGEVGGLVVGTGDLSELALGWCTYNADHMSMYGVNSSIPKTLIRWMIESVCACDLFPKATEVLKDVMDTPISPELLPPDAQGKISQKTEDVVGPYALHDFFLYYTQRFGYSREKIHFLASRAFKDDFDDETITKWLSTFMRRFATQQFKRSCLPDGVKVGSICLSPRGDWRMPSDGFIG